MSDGKGAAGGPRPRVLGDLGVRAASGLALVVVAVVTAKVGGHAFILFWLAAAIAVTWEWQRLVGGVSLWMRVGAGAAALCLIATLARNDLFDAGLTLLLATALLAALGGSGRRLWSAGGMLYVGLLVLATISLRFSFPFGSRSIFWLFATVWSTDTFAYLGGRLIGGPKLWLRISPSKTWSGTVTGLLAGTLIGTFAAVRDLPSPAAVLPILLITFAASFVSQAGDAGESALKRHFGIKDSSHLIPGHGGVMDRLDGFIAAAIFAFALGVARNLPSVAGGLFYWA